MARVHYWELSNYNNGKLIGKWFDLDGISKDDHQEELQAWLEELTEETGELCEEWILGDVEDVPDHLHGEWDVYDEFFLIQEFLSTTHLDDDVVWAGVELGISLDRIEDAYVGQFDSYEQMAEQYVDEGFFGDVSESLSFYIDYDKLGRTLSYEYQDHDGHYFQM